MPKNGMTNVFNGEGKYRRGDKGKKAVERDKTRQRNMHPKNHLRLTVSPPHTLGGELFKQGIPHSHKEHKDRPLSAQKNHIPHQKGGVSSEVGVQLKKFVQGQLTPLGPTLIEGNP